MVHKALLLLEHSGMHKLKIIITISVVIISAVLIAYVNLSGKNTEIISVENLNAPGCHVQNNDCEININGFKLAISFDKNIYYLKSFSFSVLSDIHFPIKTIITDFRMKNMEMGVNRFSMISTTTKSDNKQHWQGKALLPVCISGRADWYAEMSIQLENTRYIVSFPLQVEKL